MNNLLTHKAEKYARNVLTGFPEDFHYHDVHHTLNVVNAVERISKQSEVTGTNLENLIIAAWFHDLGYQEGQKGHEKESVRIMRDKLGDWGAEPERIEEIARLILATKMPHSPTDLLTKIMCDADLYHLCQPDFQEHSENLRKEINCLFCKNISPSEWIKMNLEFLRKHNYFTEYGKNVLGPLKNKTLNRIVRRIAGS